MSVKQPGFSSPSRKGMVSSPRTRGERHDVSLSPQETPLGCKFVPVSTLLTPSPVSRNSESFLKMPSSPKVRGTCSKSSSSSHRVLFEESILAQVDLDGVPDDEFFLVAPKPRCDPIKPMLVRPRPCRSSDDSRQETSSVVTSVPLFRSIINDDEDEEQVGVDSDKNALLLLGRAAPQPQTPLRLKPRPASLQDGQRDWSSIYTFALGDSGKEFLA